MRSRSRSRSYVEPRYWRHMRVVEGWRWNDVYGGWWHGFQVRWREGTYGWWWLIWAGTDWWRWRGRWYRVVFDREFGYSYLDDPWDDRWDMIEMLPCAADAA